jgi:hypothetical protein
MPGKVEEKALGRVSGQERVVLVEQLFLEEQGEQRLVGAWVSLRAQVLLGLEAVLPVREIGAVWPPLLLGVNELPFAQEQRVPPFSDCWLAVFEYLRLGYFSFEPLSRNSPGSRISAIG